MGVTFYSAKLTNCTCNFSSGHTMQEKEQVVITANSGYQFSNSKKYTYTYLSESKNFTVSDDSNRLESEVFTNLPSSGSVRLTAITADKATATVAYTIKGLVNCTCNKKTGDSINKGDVLTITAETGYKFSSTKDYPLTVGYDDVYFDVSENEKMLTYDVASSSMRITVDGITADSEPKTVYTYNVSGLQNCVCNKNTGDVVSNSDVLTLTANDGYEFNANVYTYERSDIEEYFDVSQDKKTLTANLSETQVSFGNVVVSNIVASLIPVVTASGFLHIYEVTPDELGKLANIRFIGDGTTYDYGINIMQLYRCHVPIKDVNKSVGIIQLGKFNSEIQSTEINDNIISMSATITTSGMIDENNYTATLFIPSLVNGIDIEAFHVFNKTVEIRLDFDLYSGQCHYSLFDNGVLFQAGVYQFSSDIPYRSYNDSVSVTNYLYNPLISDKCILNVYGSFVLPLSDLIGRYKYIQGSITGIENITDDIPENDLSEIESIISSGVYLS